MCEKSVVKSPSLLQYMPDHLKAQEMCDDPVCRRPWLLKYVPDWFITKQQIKVCFDHCGDDVIKWDNGYQKLKAQKAKIKEEIMPIASHTSIWWDWCVPEDEKKESEKLLG